MPTQSENTRRIAKNTLMLYVRMLFSMLVSLYTSRVILNALGVEDYGIYNVVGGFVTMFSLVSCSLSSSTSRFLTFELGRGDKENLKRVFSTSLTIHIVLMLIVLILMETIGVWVLNTQIKIPADRLFAANWVFQASVISFIIGLFSVTYNACIVSHERMNAFAYIGILETSLHLFIALFISYSSWHFDRLIIYAVLVVTVVVFRQYLFFLYCRHNFEECRFSLSFNKSYWKEMGVFAGWGFIGTSAGILKDNGVNILLNLFYGPIINTARGISSSVCYTISSFAGNFMTALNPQITKSYAEGNKKYVNSLVERGARFSFYIMFFFALPILLETDFILTLWLKNYPNHTVSFVRLALLLCLNDLLSNTLMTLQNATGKIRNYQIVVGCTLLMNFPLSYICLKMGAGPESTMFVAILISMCCLLLRLAFLRKTAALSAKSFLLNVYINILKVSICAAILPTLLYHFMLEGWWRFICVCLVSVLCTLISIYCIGCNMNERIFVVQAIQKRLRR